MVCVASDILPSVVASSADMEVVPGMVAIVTVVSALLLARVAVVLSNVMPFTSDTEVELGCVA